MGGKDFQRVQAHKEGLTGVCFSRVDGEAVLLSCGSDGSVCVRSAGKWGAPTSTFSVGKQMLAIAAHKDGSQFVVTEEDNYVKVGARRV